MMVRLANVFVRRGIETDLILVRREGKYFEEVDGRVRIVDLGAPRILLALPGLVSYLRERQPDALLSTLTYANVVAIWARDIAGHPERLVVREANPISSVADDRVASLKYRLTPFFVRAFYDRAHSIVGISRGLRHDLIERGGLPAHKVHAIYNPVVTQQLYEMAREPLAHRWFTDSNPVVLTAGRLTRQKDVGTLIQAFGILRNEVDARLVVLGQGELRPELEDLVRDLGLENAVELPGFVDNPFKYMARSDVFALSSRWEGFGNVLVEAMAVGTSVVSTDCPTGPAEILADGEYGRLVDVGNAPQMAEAIAGVLGSPSNPDKLKRRAREFSADHIAEQYLSLLVGSGENSTE